MRKKAGRTCERGERHACKSEVAMGLRLKILILGREVLISDYGVLGWR